ncbi:hypothetical protein DFH07DRAFT_958651 [Mycena maculata]|uniref:F-box domain-containing protein n=1 Tax=Mycena maculata TaxID=230809 RepID=A0AAD7J5W1_9AGAR|nr:hypothetical protein DFH07DRAFT_958651 [Mycena maculata]
MLINGTIVNPLRGLSSGSFPSLKSLTIGGPKGGGYHSLDPNSILDLFHRAPNLIECAFDQILTPAGHDPAPRPRVLPNLRHLRFGRSLECLYSDNGLLRYITLPGLQTLIVSMDSSNDDDEDEEVLIAFLKRSSPPLQKLGICDRSYIESDESFHFPRMQEYLPLLPTLTHIELWAPPPGFVRKLFAILASPLLPHLQSLRIVRYCSDTFPALWAVLHRALTGRRTHLTHLTILYDSDGLSIDQPDAEICDVFRQLVVVDGMEIFIGYEQQNWISV